MDFVASAAASRMLVAGSHCLYCATPLHAAENAYRGAVTPTFAAFLKPPPAGRRGREEPRGAPPAVPGRGLTRGRDDTRQKGSIAPGVSGHL
jgi:hypothetical protein